jgi:glutamate dehydrogenase/leucine dehydrogenase
MQIEKISKHFDDHRIVSYIHDKASGMRCFIAIHRGSSKVPSFGATRFVHYKGDSEALDDVLQLSKSMSYKAALAGLKYGGAKGVIMAPRPDSKLTPAIVKAYAEKVNYFGGHFITGADVGLNGKDVKTMAKSSPYMVGVKSDPVKYTVLGLFYSIQVSLNEYYGSDDFSGRTFAIQGVGKIGSNLLDLIYGKAKKIVIADLNSEAIKRVKKDYPKVEVVSADEISKQKVDVFSPCALSNAITFKNLKKINAKVIVGGANSQLEHEDVGSLLFKMGILYAPDYVVNSGGLISVVDEYELGVSDNLRTIARVQGIKKTLQKIYDASKKEKTASNIVADRMAEKIFNNH